MTDIIFTETILYRQEKTMQTKTCILRKMCKDAILAKNDDVIDLNF